MRGPFWMQKIIMQLSKWARGLASGLSTGSWGKCERLINGKHLLFCLLSESITFMCLVLLRTGKAFPLRSGRVAGCWPTLWNHHLPSCRRLVRSAALCLMTGGFYRQCGFLQQVNSQPIQTVSLWHLERGLHKPFKENSIAGMTSINWNNTKVSFNEIS